METNQLRFIVALDFDELADHLLTEAVRLARRAHAGLVLLHAAPDGAGSSFAARAQAELDGDELEESLLRLADEARESGVPTEHLVTHGATVPALIDEIERLRPDLVFVASHGRRGLGRMVRGSVSDELCRVSPVPVVVVSDPVRWALTGDEAL